MGVTRTHQHVVRLDMEKAHDSFNYQWKQKQK
jgi:hypothetical protein